MATETTKSVIDLKIETAESAKSLSEMSKALKDLKSQLDKVAAGSEDYKKLSKAINETEGKIGDLNDQFITLAGSGVERVKNSIGLFKEGLMSFDFGKIGIALKGLGSAFKAVLPFAIIEGIMYLKENFEDLTKGSGPLAQALRLVGDAISAITEFLSDAIIETSQFFSDIAGRTNDATRAYQKALDEQGEAIKGYSEKVKEALSEQTDEYDRQIRVAKANGKETVELERAKQQAIIDTNVQVAKQIEAYVRAGGVLDDEKRKLLTASLEAIKNAKVTELEIEKQHKSKLLDTEKEHTKKVKEEFQKRIDENNALSRKIEDIQISRIKNEREREETKALLDRERAIEDIEKSKAAKALKDEAILLEEEVYQQKLAEIDKKWKDKKAEEEAKAKAEEEAKAKEIAEAAKKVDDEIRNKQIADEKAANAEMVASWEKAEKDKQAATDATFKNAQLVTQNLQAISDLSFALRMAKVKKGSAEEESLMRKQFEVNKKLQIAQTVISTITGAREAYKSLAGIPIVGVPLGIAAATAATLAGLAAIQKISSTKFEGGGDASAPTTSSPSTGGGGSTSAPTTQTNAPTVQPFTRLNEDGTVVRNQPVVKAIVVESDITSSQKRVGKLENQATFG